MAGSVKQKDRKKNKTPQRKPGRNKESCENGRQVVGITVIVEPIDVPVPLAIVSVQIQDVAVAVRVPKKYTEYHPCHHPLNTLGVEYYFAYQMREYSVPSIFIFL